MGVGGWGETNDRYEDSGTGTHKMIPAEESC